MLKKQLFIISLLFGVISSAMAADPVKLYGQLQVSGNQLCSEQGEPVVLRGVSYGWHNLWPRFYNKKSVKWLKEDWMSLSSIKFSAMQERTSSIKIE